MIFFKKETEIERFKKLLKVVLDEAESGLSETVFVSKYRFILWIEKRKELENLLK